MNVLSDYIKACKAEWLKLKGSGIFWLVLIMSALIPALFTLAGLLVADSSIDAAAESSENPWKILIQQSFGGFGGFFYPLFLTLVVIRLTQMEHRGGGWKLIETQPVSRLALYTAKFSMSVWIALFCILSLVIFTLLGGLILMLAKPSSYYSGHNIPLVFILGLCFRLLIAGLGILGIQYFFSVAISGFLGPFGIGLGAIITGNILRGFGKLLWWPYTAPALTVNNPDGSATGKFLLYYEWLSLFWMLLALWLGYQWYKRRTFKLAFFKPALRLVYWTVPLVAFILLVRYINRPVQLPAYHKTVITGIIESKQPVQQVRLISEPYYDTVLVAPVVNGRIHFETGKQIIPAEYYLAAGNLSPQKVFFGSRDSLYFTLKQDGRRDRFSVSGNRLAENNYISRGEAFFNFGFYFLENSGYEMSPQAFANGVLRQWKKETAQIDNFKTQDNLKPADDFIALQKKLATIKYLRLLDIRYPNWFRVYHPNEKLEFPGFINEIRNTLSYNDSSLVSYQEYRDFITDYYEQHYRLKVSDDSAYLNRLCQVLDQGTVRDYLIYNRMKDAIGKTRDTLLRGKLLEKYLPEIGQVAVQMNLLAQHQLLKSLHRGKPAPDFHATALNRDSISLNDFKGRYVVIDVWATWCRPCKIESPNFEKFAEQYTHPKLAFVALSVDDNRMAWQAEAMEKSPRVMQIIARDKNQLSASYGIESIPRFILIGPDGRIINAQMPRPSEAEFEDLLKREIPGLEMF